MRRIKRTKQERLALRRIRDRRHRARKFCPKCGILGKTLTEVFGGNGSYPNGWEWSCPSCGFHWREYQGEHGFTKERRTQKGKWIPFR